MSHEGPSVEREESGVQEKGRDLTGVIWPNGIIQFSVTIANTQDNNLNLLWEKVLIWLSC